MIERFIKSGIQPVELGIDTYLKKVRAEEARVNDLARLLDADRKFFCLFLLLLVGTKVADSCNNAARRLESIAAAIIL